MYVYVWFEVQQNKKLWKMTELMLVLQRLCEKMPGQNDWCLLEVVRNN